VRRALVHALDRDDIRTTHLGDGTTISGPFAPRSPFYDLSVEPWPHDLDEVARLMKAAGYARKEGIYHARGRPLELRMVLSNNLDAYQDVCLDIQSRLERAGFDVELVWLDPAAYADRVIGKGRFDLTIDSWTFDQSSNIYPLFHSRGEKNHVGYANPDMDALLDRSLEAKDPEKFLDIYLAVHRLAHEDLPYVFLWSVRSYSAITRELTGIDIHPFRYFTWIEKWRFRAN
jgi:peptide/nickel transport system substrate-binding protein